MFFRKKEKNQKLRLLVPALVVNCRQVAFIETFLVMSTKSSHESDLASEYTQRKYIGRTDKRTPL